MAYKLYDYVDASGRNLIKSWTESLQKQQRAKLNQKLDLLEKNGDALMPNMLTDSGVPGIQKLRVRGNVQLRPLLCKGPANVDNEYTLLAGAKEVGFKLMPNGVEDAAQQRKMEVTSDLGRRKKHERTT